MEKLAAFGRFIERINSNSKNRFKQNPNFIDESFVMGAVGVGPVTVYEAIRSTLVNPQSRLDKGEYAARGLPEPTEPIIGPGDIDPIAYEALQTTGDILWGYNFSYAANLALNSCEVLLKRRMPEKVKAGISAGIGLAAIITAETGLVHGTVELANTVFIIGTATQDWRDIAGGAIGPAFWLVMNHLGNRIKKSSPSVPRS